jgi:hypothetical protein
MICIPPHIIPSHLYSSLFVWITPNQHQLNIIRVSSPTRSCLPSFIAPLLHCSIAPLLLTVACRYRSTSLHPDYFLLLSLSAVSLSCSLAVCLSISLSLSLLPIHFIYYNCNVCRHFCCVRFPHYYLSSTALPNCDANHTPIYY